MWGRCNILFYGVWVYDCLVLGMLGLEIVFEELMCFYFMLILFMKELYCIVFLIF